MGGLYGRNGRTRRLAGPDRSSSHVSHLSVAGLAQVRKSQGTVCVAPVTLGGQGDVEGTRPGGGPELPGFVVERRAELPVEVVGEGWARRRDEQHCRQPAELS